MPEVLEAIAEALEAAAAVRRRHAAAGHQNAPQAQGARTLTERARQIRP
jgi:hypothetical protein